MSCGFGLLLCSLLIRQLVFGMCLKVTQFYNSIFGFVHIFFFNIRCLASMAFILCFDLASFSEGNPLFLSSFSI